MADTSKVRRNDPCPCGSGKKYKRCCMIRDKAAQAERVAWERAAQDMRGALIGFAKESEFVKDLAVALGLFWQDRYTADTIHLMSVDESLRFFDWFAHDYALRESSTGAGKRLIEVYRDQAGDALSEKEAAILDGWIESLPGSAFVLKETDAERGLIVIRDLFLPRAGTFRQDPVDEGTARVLTVQDTSAAKYGEIGQILLTRPLAGGRSLDHMRLSGATAVLPPTEEDGLRAFIEEARQTYLADQPVGGDVLPHRCGRRCSAERGRPAESTMARFLRDRAYLLTHYALQWADREGRPAVSAQDPAEVRRTLRDAQKPGGKALQKLIKWSQERVQVH